MTSQLPSSDNVYHLKRVESIVVPKRTRRSGFKSRAGCLSCKKRHLKCDEKKPGCDRCSAAGLICQGYSTNQKPSSSYLAKYTKLVPQSVVMRNGIVRPPPHKLFAQSDIAYFDRFQHQVVPDLTGIWHLDFWNYIVLQEAIQDECVRHSVIGLGALVDALSTSPDCQARPFIRHKSVRFSQTALHRSALASPLNKSHRDALKHTTTALSMLRRRVADQDRRISPRTILIATILLLQFEFLHGNYESADDLLISGLGFLKDLTGYSVRATRFFTDRTLNQVHTSTTLKTNQAVWRSISHMIPRLFFGNAFSPFSMAYNEDSDVKAIWAGVHCFFPDPERDSFDQMVQMWSDYVNYLCIFENRCMWHGMRSRPSLATSALALRNERVGHLRNLSKWEYLHMLYSSMASITASHDLNKRLEATRRRKFATLHTMKMNIIVQKLLLESCLDRSSTMYDRFTEDFQLVVKLGGTFLTGADATTSGHSYEFHRGPHPALCFTVMLCRHRETRETALSHLRAINCRSGVNMKAMAAGLEALVALEESGADDNGTIPASSRFGWVAGWWEEDVRKLIVIFRRQQLDSWGNPVMIRLAVDIE